MLLFSDPGPAGGHASGHCGHAGSGVTLTHSINEGPGPDFAPGVYPEALLQPDSRRYLKQQPGRLRAGGADSSGQALVTMNLVSSG